MSSSRPYTAFVHHSLSILLETIFEFIIYNCDRELAFVGIEIRIGSRNYGMRYL